MIFRLEFINFEENTIRVDISPTDDPTTTVFPLTGTGTPLVISTINNDQEKFQPIRSKQAVIQFISDSGAGTDITTFSKGADDLWTVVITIVGGDTIFTGFLILSDNQQPFQPDPQTVQLTATDHLGALKDIALVDYQDNNPMGRYRIADLVTMALRKTGLSLDLYVVNNLRIGSGTLSINAIFQNIDSLILLPANTFWFYSGQQFTITGSASNDGTYTVAAVGYGIVTIVQVWEAIVNEASVAVVIVDLNSDTHCYDLGYVDAKTFESEIGECEDCYTALAKILGEDCFISQWKGAWWIMRVDEFDVYLIYAARFLPDGTFDSIAAGTTYSKPIGAGLDLRFANADTLLQFIRPHGYVKETYNFALPLEIPCNVDFSRGALQASITASESHFDLECWYKLWSNTSTDDPATAAIYIRRNYINDQEVQRYVVIEADVNLNFIKSERIYVNVQDKFNIDVSVRTSTNIGGSGSYTINAIQVRLTGDDGTFWTAHGKKDPSDLVPTWVASDVTFRTSLGYFYMQGDLSQTDFTQSQGLFSGESAEIPVGGYLEILIFANPEDVTARETYIDKLTFDYLGYVNGSYIKYSNYYNRVDRTASGYMAKRDEQVFVEDSPSKLFKGAFLFVSRYQEFLSANTIFTHNTLVDPPENSFTLSGNQTLFFFAGQIIKIVATATTYTKVLQVIYNVGGDFTIVVIQATVTNITETAAFSDSVWALTSLWYSAAPIALALNTDPTRVHSYGYIQAFSVWNQFRGVDDIAGRGQGINIFTGSVLGLTTDWPDLLHKYFLTDTNAQTNDRYFMLLSMSQDWRSCIWTATLVEVINTVAGKVYTDNFEFKFVAQ